MNRYGLNDTMIRALLLSAGLAFGFGIGMPAFAVDTAAPSQAHAGAVSDAEITAEVKRRLASAESLKKSDIKVATANGVVTLSGTVSDPHAKFAAAAIVITVNGVRILDDELKTASDYVLPAQAKPSKAVARRAVPDSRITADVKELLAQSLPKRYKVDVRTTQGVVYLSGDLMDRDAIERIRGMVANVDGVKSVNTLGVDAPFVTMAY